MPDSVRPAGATPLADDALDRASFVLGSLLAQNSGEGRVSLRFAALSSGTNAATTTFLVPVQYSQVAGFLGAFAFINNESLDEQTLYENLPISSFIADIGPGPFATVVVNFVATSVAIQWGIPRPFDQPFDMEINVNNTTLGSGAPRWDFYDLDNALTAPPRATNFQQSFIHECIHGLGFNSSTGFGTTIVDHWDIFRLPFVGTGNRNL
ncbi:MAG: hypothetical protein K2W85_06805 [Phycisphaerales bacterium]|nr:hypothetical protein [Phycisphaerales bacterium]